MKPTPKCACCASEINGTPRLLRLKIVDASPALSSARSRWASPLRVGWKEAPCKPSWMRIALGSPKLPSRSPSIPDHSGRADDSYLSAQSRLGLALSIVGGTLTLAADVVLVLMTTQALTSGLAFFLMGPYLAAFFGMSITSPLMM